MEFQTERLRLREVTPEDFQAWYAILSDPAISIFYPEPFDEVKVHAWIQRQLDRYREYGFGLWAVELKETGELIGDCGLTMQMIHGELLPEIGYHIGTRFQRCGYASEAAAKCIELAFSKWRFPAVYSYMKYTNVPSAATAMKNGMRFIEEYDDPVNTRTRVYRITCEEWAKRQSV